MTDFALIGTWYRYDEGDEVRYTFEANGKMKMHMLQIDFDTEYSADGSVITVKNLEEGEPDNRLFYKIRGGKLAVWQENTPPTVLTRVVNS